MPAVVAGSVAVERFLREADILRRLRHRHIVTFRAVGQADGLLWFAMDLIEGMDAAKLVARDGRLEPTRAVRMLLPVLGALTYAHSEGFVHRDIKPANLLVTAGSNEEARLADFGLARTYQASQLSGLTATGSIAGTPVYMAPEQVLSLRTVKPPADQYGAAATIYFLLAGTAPYDRTDNPHMQIVQILEHDPVPLLKRNPALPKKLAAVIHKAMQREVDDRFPNVAEFAAALTPFAG
jgi:serine/threonine-protein kinase